MDGQVMLNTVLLGVLILQVWGVTLIVAYERGKKNALNSSWSKSFERWDKKFESQQKKEE